MATVGDAFELSEKKPPAPQDWARQNVTPSLAPSGDRAQSHRMELLQADCVSLLRQDGSRLLIYPLTKARMVGLASGTLPAMNLPGLCSTPMTLPDPKGPIALLQAGIMLCCLRASPLHNLVSLYAFIPSLSLPGVTLSSTASPRCQVTASMKPAVSGPRSLFCLLWGLTQYLSQDRGHFSPQEGQVCVCSFCT